MNVLIAVTIIAIVAVLLAVLKTKQSLSEIVPTANKSAAVAAAQEEADEAQTGNS